MNLGIRNRSSRIPFIENIKNRVIKEEEESILSMSRHRQFIVSQRPDNSEMESSSNHLQNPDQDFDNFIENFDGPGGRQLSISRSSNDVGPHFSKFASFNLRLNDQSINFSPRRKLPQPSGFKS